MRMQIIEKQKAFIFMNEIEFLCELIQTIKRD